MRFIGSPPSRLGIAKRSAGVLATYSFRAQERLVRNNLPSGLVEYRFMGLLGVPTKAVWKQAV